MCGSATVAMVLSSTCISTPSIVPNMIIPRWKRVSWLASGLTGGEAATLASVYSITIVRSSRLDSDSEGLRRISTSGSEMIVAIIIMWNTSI